MTAEKDIVERLSAIRRRVDAASPAPWAYESVSEKANDYIVGIACPVDEKGNPGAQVSGNLKDHPHFFNTETGEFGEWHCEEVARLDEAGHTTEAAPVHDAAFIAHAREDLPFLLDTITSLRAEVEKSEKLVYAPGRWKCVKCNFTLLQSTLHASNGTVTARDEAGDTCPNCNSPLWRVSWKQEAEENLTIAEGLQARAMTAEAERDAALARAEKAWVVSNGNDDEWRCWKDGFSAWTNDINEATRYSRREDAEAVHQEDEDAWHVKEVSFASLSEGE